MRPVITSEKHYVQNSLFAIASGVATGFLYANAVAVQDKNVDNEVVQGSLVKAIYIEMWVTSDDAAAGSAIWIIEKIPANQASATAAQMADLGSYPNKNNIFHTGMGLISPNTQYPMNLIKGWFKIPKGKQRMSLKDSLKMTIFAQTNGISGCGFSTFKEYT